jgi:hypothetical protein
MADLFGTFLRVIRRPDVEPITDEMCAAALDAERSRAWQSDELRVWAMLAAARDAAAPLNQPGPTEPDTRKEPS